MGIAIREGCIDCKVDSLSPMSPITAEANIKTSITTVNLLRVSLPCSMEQELLPYRGQLWISPQAFLAVMVPPPQNSVLHPLYSDNGRTWHGTGELGSYLLELTTVRADRNNLQLFPFPVSFPVRRKFYTSSIYMNIDEGKQNK